MSDFTIKQYDTLPSLTAFLKVGGAIIPDLANAATVKLAFAKRTAPDVFVFVGTGSVVDVNKGQVVYSWLSGDTDLAGEFLASWHITYNNGNQRRVPTIGFFTILIDASIPEVP